ncbi:hypothetical protein KGF47_18060 [Clostridioides sp. ZZV13-5731]|uniref:hypothetical protein n=1 Tax=Clostridioides sp. ZZV13-5731 TaxID=2811485 RepID=UPI001D115471|nr:hypothetical protein [Clostridioides sp. ZZV13-5731]
MKKNIEYIVDYSNPGKIEAYREIFSTLKDAELFKSEIIKKYKNIDITKKTVFKELICRK